ncbi:hypothetical protein LCGC14_0477470 [marine sediment metagenome]|uniref:Uncharacterized protein n=1 Tax=marine sediment metagenome TaxID=412755 RepID=A0A0F9UXB4_9ZZZZ
MVKKRIKKDLLERIFFGKPTKRKAKVKKEKVKFKAISPEEIRITLKSRIERTAQKILDNPRASGIEKARARRILSQ